MNKSEQIARLRLIRTRNIGPMTYSLLMRRYGSAEAAIAAIPTLAQRGGSKISLASIASVKAEFDSIDAAGAVLLWRDSEYYPERLAQFDDAPACITARGNLHLLTQPIIAIVGARNASINAQRHAHNIASALGKHGYIIVSGMACGIDAAAHRSGSLITAREAATRGSDVMAVPGSPLDPRSDGCNRLIRDGTTLVQNVADVIECVSRQPTVSIPPEQFEWTDSMRQTIDQTAVDRCRQKLA
jgi:DNA processing protein